MLVQAFRFRRLSTEFVNFVLVGCPFLIFPGTYSADPESDDMLQRQWQRRGCMALFLISELQMKAEKFGINLA